MPHVLHLGAGQQRHGGVNGGGVPGPVEGFGVIRCGLDREGFCQEDAGRFKQRRRPAPIREVNPNP